MIPSNNFTYGFEIEWGDIDRKLKIPEHLGKWEYCETDIVNILEPYKYVACDPLGIEPNFGGEINTIPTKTWQEQVNNIMSIYDFFIKNNNTPTVNCISHSHIHVHIPNLIDDIHLLKKLMLYIKTNQEIAITSGSNFIPHPNMKKLKNCTLYTKYDGGRRMPNYMLNNIINLSYDFPSFIKQHCTGKDGVSMGRPFRYGINTYSLKHTKTIEFRFFRGSIDKKEISDMFFFVEQFLYNALNEQKPIQEILNKYFFSFPQLNFSTAQWNGYLKTKYNKDRGQKKRDGYIKI